MADWVRVQAKVECVVLDKAVWPGEVVDVPAGALPGLRVLYGEDAFVELNAAPPVKLEEPTAFAQGMVLTATEGKKPRK